jgi:hypothetical protein
MSDGSCAFSASSFALRVRLVFGRDAMSGVKSAGDRNVGALRVHAAWENRDARQLHLRESRVDDVGPELHPWK